METIDELIISEFTKAGYSAIGKIDNAPIYANDNKTDFLLIVDDYDIDVEYQKDMADAYGKATAEYMAADKNTSILVLKNVDNMNEANQKWAVEMENDKFYFKKYVLLYTDAAWAMLKNNILQEEERSLSSYLVDATNFEKLKADASDGAYSLLYGIAHKLPFLLVEMQKSKLELAYPTSWSSPTVLETNDWVNRIPNENQAIEEYLDEILNSVGNEQD